MLDFCKKPSRTDPCSPLMNISTGVRLPVISELYYGLIY